MAVLDLVSLSYEIYRVPILVFYDNSYQGEVYTAWVIRQCRVHAQWCFRDLYWTLTDLQLYITALSLRNEGSCTFVQSIVTVCRGLLESGAPPRHLYSHITGIFLDEVLDIVDAVPKDVAAVQSPGFGWVLGLQEPLVVFTRAGRQIQDI